MDKHQVGEHKIYSINNPLLFTIDNFLPEECIDMLLEDIDKHVKFHEAKVVGEKGKSIKDRRRTNLTGNTIHYLQSTPAQTFLDMAAATLRLHPSQAEPLSIIKYKIGQQYEPHYDTFEPDTLSEHTPLAGQRVATALLYLTDVQDGGETDFPKMGITISPKKGRCVFFSTTMLGTEQQNDLSYHGALPVNRGEKIAVNLWFRRGVYDNDMYQKWLKSEQNSYK